MLVLGVETSCDETAAGVIKDDGKILSNVVFSQKIHEKYGGVVPEIASRVHISQLVDIVDEALCQAGITFDDLDGLAVTYGPGLVGCLLVGLSFVKSIHLVKKIPFYGVNHLEGHIFAGKLAYPELKTPHIALVVSGGHSNLYLVKDWGQYKLLGSTYDDAAGEAFDKVAKLIGLGYPGGPSIEKASLNGDKQFVRFPRALEGKENYDFSFSGLKTAVSVYLQSKSAKFVDEHRQDLAASFQEAAVEVIVKKTLKAAMDFDINQVSITGGVACNKRMRDLFGSIAEKKFHVFFPSPELCTDNGAVIAACGAFYLKRGKTSDLSLNAIPYLEL